MLALCQSELHRTSNVVILRRCFLERRAKKLSKIKNALAGRVERAEVISN